MDPITLPSDRKPILVIHPLLRPAFASRLRTGRQGFRRRQGFGGQVGGQGRHIKSALGGGLIIALIAAIMFNLAASGGQAATFTSM